MYLAYNDIFITDLKRNALVFKKNHPLFLFYRHMNYTLYLYFHDFFHIRETLNAVYNLIVFCWHRVYNLKRNRMSKRHSIFDNRHRIDFQKK